MFMDDLHFTKRRLGLEIHGKPVILIVIQCLSAEWNQRRKKSQNY